MDLKLRAANKAGKLSMVAQTKLWKTKKKSIPHPISKGEWHDLLVHVKDDRITAVIDGRQVGNFQSEGFAHPTKGLLRLLTTGHAVGDDVRILRRQ